MQLITRETLTKNYTSDFLCKILKQVVLLADPVKMIIVDDLQLTTCDKLYRYKKFYTS